MLPKPEKAFDCVEMKRKAQEELHAEYEAHKNEFPSYFAFLEARTSKSAWQKEFWTKIANAPTRTK
ncbi:MAG: hypothetical protein WCB27_25775 [Thermoguttaceae bacterium]